MTSNIGDHKDRLGQICFITKQTHGIVNEWILHYDIDSRVLIPHQSFVNWWKKKARAVSDQQT